MPRAISSHTFGVLVSPCQRCPISQPVSLRKTGLQVPKARRGDSPGQRPGKTNEKPRSTPWVTSENHARGAKHPGAMPRGMTNEMPKVNALGMLASEPTPARRIGSDIVGCRTGWGHQVDPSELSPVVYEAGITEPPPRPTQTFPTHWMSVIAPLSNNSRCPARL
jgi:hypothetical protein